MARIVHTGDLHFCTPFQGFPPNVAERFREEQFASFEKTIEYVKEINADALLLAGDLFENEYVSYRILEFLRRCFASIPETHVFISPGNHDCIMGNDIYAAESLGENVTVFGEEISCVLLPEAGVRVYGTGLLNQTSHKDILLGFHAPRDGIANIFLAHCSLPPYGDLCPVSARRLSESGIDYFAAGHIHSHEGFKKAGSTVYAYCGTPEGRFLDECGKKGIIAGDVTAENVSLSFKNTAKREVHKLNADISDAITYGDIIGKLGKLCKNDIYNIELCGTIGRNMFFDTNTLSEMLSERVFYANIKFAAKREGKKPDSIAEKLFGEILHERTKSGAIAAQAEMLGLAALRGEKLEEI